MSVTNKRIPIEQAKDEINQAFRAAALEIGELLPFPASIKPAPRAVPKHVDVHSAIFPFGELKPLPENNAKP
ncbi:hypothetical protein [Neptuniibacter sp. QD37_11]|uniref:hypothetical protein n=1 Tax=Neptuniibacter sp. QD37_11 TaxID=3398209 RepID=UPI0039F56DD5